MKAITYQIRLLEPALVSEMAGDPNAAVAFDYVPGSVLRGVFVGQYLKTHPGIDAAADDEARRWFFNGETRWLNAYPLDRSGKRSLPVPRSIHRDKNGDENEVFDLAICEPQDDRQQWKALGKPFCLFKEDREIRLVEPRRQISVHTARTRRHGRARSREQEMDNTKGDTPGGVYLYDALADGGGFEAVVLCTDKDADKIKAMLDEAATGAVKIGKSLTGGYGKAKIEKVSAPKADWREYVWPEFLTADDAAAQTSLPDGKLVITLLSDAFLRDEATGQYTVEKEAITDLLNKELGVGIRPERQFIGQNILGGFNRKWGLPLPQAQAFAAGSVLVFTASGVSPQKIIALLEKGIGERRAEGFGRLAINWQSEAKLKKEDEERIREQERKNYTPKNIALAAGTPEAKIAERVIAGEQKPDFAPARSRAGRTDEARVRARPGARSEFHQGVKRAQYDQSTI